MYWLINVFATKQFRSFWWLKIAQIAQLNQLFQRLHLVHIHGHAFYELSRTLIRKNVNNDVSKDSPIFDSTAQFRVALRLLIKTRPGAQIIQMKTRMKTHFLKKGLAPGFSLK